MKMSIQHNVTDCRGRSSCWLHEHRLKHAIRWANTRLSRESIFNVGKSPYHRVNAVGRQCDGNEAVVHKRENPKKLLMEIKSSVTQMKLNLKMELGSDGSIGWWDTEDMDEVPL